MFSLSLLALLSSLPPAALAQEAPPPPAEELPPLVKNPELVDFVQAPFPPEAQAAGVQGSVLLLIEIDAAGAVTRVEVLEGIGYGFDEAALQAAQQFRFSPAEDTTGPIPVAIEFEYGFVLDAAEVEGAVPEEPPAPAELPITVEGQAIEMATRRPLPDMAVALAGTDYTTSTDAEGRFSLRGVPPGAYTLVIARPGWDTKEAPIEVVEGQVTAAQLWVRNQSYEEGAAVGVYQRAKDEVTRRTITMGEVKRIPGTFGDPVRVVQNLPGAARAPFGSGVLIIRGANPEDSGVYVEGVRIPLIYHLGGYVSVINPDLVGMVDYLPGNFGAQYGRSLGGVIDVRIKDDAPEQGRLTWSTDLLDSGGLYEGRLGKNGQHQVGVAARRSYIDLVLPLVPSYGRSGLTVRPRWADYQVRYAYTGLDKTRVTAFVFGFTDKLLVGTSAEVPQGTDQDTQDDLSVEYSSHRALLKIQHPFSDALQLTVVPAFGWDHTYFGSGQAFRLEQDQWILQVRSELGWTPAPWLEVLAGTDLLSGYSTFGFEAPIDPQAFVEYDPLAEREPTTIDGDGWGHSPDVYVKANVRPFVKDPERLLIQPGLRLSPVLIVDELFSMGWDPRVLVRARVVKDGYLKAASGLFTQPPQPFEAYNPDPDAGVDLVHEKSWSTTLGYEQQITQGLSVEVELFNKQLYDLIVDNPNLVSLDTDAFFLNEGVGRIRGMELMIRQAAINNAFGWVSYTLSRSERRDHPGEDWVLFDFDQTHILTVLGGYKLPWAVEVSGRFQYVTGNPFTPYSNGVYDIDQDSYTPYASGSSNSQRLPPYSALDLRVQKGFTFQKWRMDAYVDLLNVYRGTNPEFVNYNYDYTEYSYVRGLPFIPSPGVNIEVYL